MSAAGTLSDLRSSRPVSLETGLRVVRDRARAIDGVLAGIVDESLGASPGIALVAVGGYGRGELSPRSDVDVVILGGDRLTAATVRSLLYPLWDAGWQVGHATRSPKEAVAAARADLAAATSLLSARFVAGERELFEELERRRARWLELKRKTVVRRILSALRDRHDSGDRAGWMLAPDLKEDAGGLRDVHTLCWLRAIHPVTPVDVDLDGPVNVLLAVREILHELFGRKRDLCRMDVQPRVAAALHTDADELMRRVHGAARIIEYGVQRATLNVAERLLGGPRRSGSAVRLEGGAALYDGTVDLPNGADVTDPATALRLLAHSSLRDRPIAGRLHPSMRIVLASEFTWTAEKRDALLLLLKGPAAAGVLELIDHLDGWTSLLPEWRSVRGLAQHDPYHRFTVDGHSFRTVGEVSRALSDDSPTQAASAELGSLDSLYLGALLHDCGKGSGEDHSIAGEQIALNVGKRIGLPHRAVIEIGRLVRLHLLLADTATRRDLDDCRVIETVARLVGSPRLLRLLFILTTADGRATGPEAWTDWKATLVTDLYRKVLSVMETGELPVRGTAARRAREVESLEPALAGRAIDLLSSLPYSYIDSVSTMEMVDELKLLDTATRSERVSYRFDEAGKNRVVLVLSAPDRPGLLAKTAGVLALHRMDVLKAQAYSTGTGLALQRFVVKAPTGSNLDAIASDLEAALSGRLAIDARLAAKAVDYNPSEPVEVDVRLLPDSASPHSTVVEVRARDRLGLLHAMVAGIADLDLDVHVAKIDTLGSRVVDVFYVRTRTAQRLDREQAEALSESIRHRALRLSMPPR